MIFPIVIARCPSGAWLATCALFADVWAVAPTRELAREKCCERTAAALKERGSLPAYEIEMVTINDPTVST